MNLFKKLFGKGSSGKQEGMEGATSKYMPKEEIPVDEQFMLSFTEKGGKFLYCEDIHEAHEIFQNILLENNLENPEVCCLQDHIKAEFSSFNLNYTTKNTSSFFLCDCEYLVGNIGGILVSSNQLKEKKLFELPDHFVILSYTSQLIRDLSEGLQGIKNKTGNIPTNITTLQHFGKKKESDDFLSYGSTSKNTYLLLVEDL